MKDIIKLLQTAHDNLDDAQDKKQVYDALIDDIKTDLLTAIKQLKLFAIPVVIESICKEKDTDCAMCEVMYKCNSTDICLHSKQTVL